MKREYNINEILDHVAERYKNALKFDINNNEIHNIKEWLKEQEITEYIIIELFSYILFYNEKDATIYAIGYNK